MDNDLEKQDRVPRLMHELALFQAIPHGLTTRDLAERMDISQRQTPSDLKMLEQERVVWPLFLEPNATGHCCYLLAWDQKRQAVRSYRLERISSVQVMEERFDPPLGFSVGKHLAHAWGIWTSQQPVDIVLRFDSGV